ncbi:unnamed protein product, partial [Mesorhabditis spiculigera]
MMARVVVLFSGLILTSSAGSLADQLCFRDPTSLFCQERANGQRNRSEPILLSGEDSAFLRLAREAHDDPSCPTLKEEYDNACFTIPPVQALMETKGFCDAFVDMCSELLKTNLFTRIRGFRLDFTRYCKKEKDRFQFVCPDPLRFHSYAQDAVEFCVRCPEAEVPSKPIPFPKKTDHIFTREIKQFCDKLANFAANYCTNPDILRVPRYQYPCGIYKYKCIDVYTEVIYGWGR